jgi:hypothetical protein
MSPLLVNPIRTKACALLLSVAASGVLLAQDARDAAPWPDEPAQQQDPEPNGPWRRMGGPTQSAGAQNPNYPGYPANPGQGPNARAGGSDDPQGYQNYPPPPPVPAQLTIKSGTFVTVRLNQVLSSDRNQAGDAFTATLVRPIVVDGVVVAQRGQIIAGRVAEAQKAGRVEGVSKLGVQLTDLTLVDGQQLPLQSALVSRTGGTSEGRDAAGIIGTTAAGAAIGAGVNGGVGAGVGAGIGGIVGTIGVLLTRGRPTVINPESVLTFRVEAPVTFSTERSARAFYYVDPNEYERSGDLQTRTNGRAPYGAYPAPPPYWGPAYPYPYWGPSVSFFYGRGYYGRGFYHGGYRGGFRR